MKRLFLVAVLVCTALLSRADEIDVLKQKVVQNLVAYSEVNAIVDEVVEECFSNGYPPDDCLRELVAYNPPTDQVVKVLWDQMKADGSWGDIDYTSRERSNWPQTKHLENMRILARGYKNSKSIFYNDPKLRDALITTMEFWCDGGFVCNNWWYNQIGIPKLMGPVMLMIEDDLSESLKAKGIKVLDKARIGMTGQNKVWLSGIVFMKGLLLKDKALLKASSEAIRSEMKISDKEGLQSDFSFQQHGAQLQNGNYGLAFAVYMSYWMNIFDGSSYAFEPEQIVQLRNFLIKGYGVGVWRGVLDVSSCGRQLFKNSMEGKAAAAIIPVANMMQIDKAAQKDYRAYLDRNYKKPYKNELYGNFNYDRSKYVVHRTKDFMFSVRMSSKKIQGGETTNNENLKGYYLGDGATMIYHNGGEYNNIFPVWDGKLMPGTTVKFDNEPLKVLSPSTKYFGGGEFVGGVGEGVYGVSAMEYVRDGVKAQKSWIFLGSKVICLGNSISSDNGVDLVTTLNQTFSRDAAYYDGKVVAKGDVLISKKVLSDGVGYESLDGSNIEFFVKKQSGDWHDIANFIPTEKVQGDVFTARIIHDGTKVGSYAYSVQPGVKAKQFFSDKNNDDFVVVRNDSQVTAVESRSNKVGFFIFWKASEVESDLFGTIKSKTPMILMVTGSKKSHNCLHTQPTGENVDYSILSNE